MALDLSLMSEHVAAHMDALDADYDGSWHVAAVITVVELVDEYGNGQIRGRSAPEVGPRTSQLIGMLESAKAVYVDRQRRR